MIANALLITVVLLLALDFWLMGELKFFAPYKLVLWREYATPILTYVALLSVNVFGAAFIFIRKFFLKDTGRKLSHLDKQIHTGATEVPALWFEEETELKWPVATNLRSSSRTRADERERKAQQSSHNDVSRDRVRDKRAQRADSHANPGAARSPALRRVYEIRGRTYRLRTSEIATIVGVRL